MTTGRIGKVAALALVLQTAGVLAPNAAFGRAEPTAHAHPSQVGEGERTRGFTIDGPFTSIEESEALLAQLGRQLELFHDYEPVADPEGSGGACRVHRVSGLSGARCLAKVGADAERTVELALSTGPRGRIEILVHGLETSSEAESPNPELALVRERLEALIEVALELPPAPAPRQTARFIYSLSFTQADRALAVLKSLGYPTVEYERTSGESESSSIYEELPGGGVDRFAGADIDDGMAAPSGRLPTIIKLIDTPSSALASTGATISSATDSDFSGTSLVDVTTAEPQQRLMILYDPDDRAALEDLLNLLRTEIDVAARQVVIEALIVELSADNRRELGIDFGRASGQTTGAINPITGPPGISFAFDLDGDCCQDESGSFDGSRFRLGLSALFNSGDAELLASPSVMVLDGRQARIQIGRRVPIIEVTTTAVSERQSVEYFPVGIMLNLRPRVSDDGEQISLRVEANVSAVVRQGSAEIENAPTVESRLVESFVRLANDTPFIIGGLIQDEVESRRTGVPVLSAIPLLGNLFKRTEQVSLKREVIIVLTPHVVPVDERAFRYLIPKDSDIFDSFDRGLYRNVYRIRSEDAFFDLASVTASDEYRDLRGRVEEYASEVPVAREDPLVAGVLRGGVPGEEVLVRRMLWEVVRDTGLAEHIALDRIIFFEADPDAADGSGFQLRFLQPALESLRSDSRALAISFDATARNTLERPLETRNATTSTEPLASAEYNRRLRAGNRRDADGTPQEWTVLLSDRYQGTRAPLAALRDVLVMQEVLRLNPTLELNLESFHAGRQLIFPTVENLRDGFHVIDRAAARYFYEAMHYYAAFQSEYRRQRAELDAVLAGR